MNLLGFSRTQSLLTFLLGYLNNLKMGPGEFKVINDPYQVKRYDNGFYHNGQYDLNLGVRFRLWTRQNPLFAHEVVVWNRHSLSSSNFDQRRVTKIFLHGANHRATEKRLDKETAYLRDAYTTFADVNFIVMDWTILASQLSFLTNNGEIAAQRLAQFLTFLDKNGTPLESVHLIGHSWGAHVAGLAGKKLNGRVGRITGIDPAGPFYLKPFNFNPKRRLDRNDAKFVDVIHSDSGRFLSRREAHLGIPEAIGHVDFFPAGGKKQPGCPLKTPIFAKEFYCSHERGILYFAESVGTPFSFPSCRCKDYDNFARNQCDCAGENMSFMGEHCPRSRRGNYFVNIRDNPNGGPYGLGPQTQVILKSITNAPTFIQTETRSTIPLQTQFISNATRVKFTENVAVFNIPSYSSKDYGKNYRDAVIYNLYSSLSNYAAIKQ